MFVTTRKPDQSVQIGTDTTVHVLRSSAGRVKLGIVAPQGVPLLRGELVEQGVLPEPHSAPLLRHVLASITPDGQFISKFVADPDRDDQIIGTWAEDGSHYRITCPAPLRHALLTLLNATPRLLGTPPLAKTMLKAA